jgi:hypothetical protein
MVRGVTFSRRPPPESQIPILIPIPGKQVHLTQVLAGLVFTVAMCGIMTDSRITCHLHASRTARPCSVLATGLRGFLILEGPTASKNTLFRG